MPRNTRLVFEGRPACQRRVFVTTEGDPISEMAARGTDRQRRPSMNYRPATSGGADRTMWRSASSSAWRHRRCSPTATLVPMMRLACVPAVGRGLLDDARNLADPELL